MEIIKSQSPRLLMLPSRPVTLQNVISLYKIMISFLSTLLVYHTNDCHLSSECTAGVYQDHIEKKTTKELLSFTNMAQQPMEPNIKSALLQIIIITYVFCHPTFRQCPLESTVKVKQAILSRRFGMPIRKSISSKLRADPSTLSDTCHDVISYQT